MKSLLYKLFIENTKDIKLQFFRYLFVGGIAAVVNIGTLYIFTDIIKIHYLIANAIGFLLGLTVNYILSRLLVFSVEKADNRIFEFLSYSVIGLLGLGLDTLFMWIGTSLISIYYMLTKVISTGLVFIWNFGARKLLYIIIDRNKIKE
jgi:putative flippase GtrA